MCDNCVLDENDIKFLDEQKKLMVASGARIDMENKKIEDLSKEIQETSSSLRFFL